MSSGVASYGRIRFDDLQWERGRYSPNLSYAQSKLADLMMTLRLADLATQNGWNLMSNGAHPGFTRTNLQTAGASLGRDKPKRTPFNVSFNPLPSQAVEQGTEPLLYAATDPGAVNGGYYGPSRWFGLVGPTTIVRPPRRARDAATAARLWSEAEHLTGVALPGRRRPVVEVEGPCTKRAALQEALQPIDLPAFADDTQDVLARGRSAGGAALLARPADPGGEQVTEADHAAHGASFHDREMPEAVQEHHLGRVLDGGIRLS